MFSAYSETDFFIIGTAKCGSTTIASILASHPDCCHSAPKETNYFSLNYELGWDWYRGTFAHYDGESILGEASVSYTTHLSARTQRHESLSTIHRPNSFV